MDAQTEPSTRAATGELAPSGPDGALSRVLAAAGGPAVLETLADRLPGSDLTTLLLAVLRRRAARLSAADVLRRYRSDRFVSPGSVSHAALRRAEDAMLGELPAGFDVLALAPVLPLGAHTATGGVDPRNVIATIRGSEVAADPTNGLALEAAVRRGQLLRGAPRCDIPVRLAASQRVTRAQAFAGPVSFAHFQLLGAVTAGRDTGNLAFEREHLIEHLRFAARGVAAVGAQPAELAITCLDDAASRVFEAVRAGFAGQADVVVREAPERDSGRAYYRCLCFKVYATGRDGSRLEVGDGGFTDWTARLLGNRKERLLISGFGVDRLALLVDERAGQPRG